ncbi:hypothetical protein GLE_1312 [Lysobacter enzymogenes]|uniref:Uncharacterized protein n=1 Tax=Lysobacter enzymogenes TaxID=69 RepID=A0A0S2DEC9_LYSEN|nr:hypothetical protein GLE_1312 [Lysobacter enzymogenes]
MRASVGGRAGSDNPQNQAFIGFSYERAELRRASSRGATGDRLSPRRNVAEPAALAAFVGGASAPMLFALIAAIWNKSIGVEAPPTKAVLMGPIT